MARRVERLHGGGGAPIAARENRHAVRFPVQVARDVFDHRRLARAAERDVTYSNDGCFKPARLAVAGFVSGDAQAHRQLIEFCRQPDERPLEFFVLSNHRIRSRIAATVQRVAPRFDNKICRARTPIACAASRSCSRRRNSRTSALVIASPTAATCTTAPASAKSATICRKFSVCGPTMMGRAKAAGSMMLWPPRGTRLPPTKTTLAKR